MERIRAVIRVHGIVQGVGFRPFVHRRVTEYALSGWIRNTSAGAELELEGAPEAVDRFLTALRADPPPLAVIEDVEVERCADLRGYTDFRIVESKTLDERDTLISPDVGICPDCLRELLDPRDRRYRYPFINCTNCGPRFTIIRDIPYDRRSTTMVSFPMCPPCAREYHDITDRRYHAQPTCCPDCGPQLSFLDADGQAVAGDPLTHARQLLLDGRILAVKGLGGIHLAGRIDDPAIARTLRARKHRDAKPFAVMCRDPDAARRLCVIDADEERALTGFRRPIVLLRKRADAALGHLSENGWLGVMLPYTPLHVLLMDGLFDALIMTSANLSDRPILHRNGEAVAALRGIADGFLLHDREIETRCDDSLLWVVDGREYPVRRSRGYVPLPVPVREDAGQTLACGAEQKAVFSISKGRYVFPSQHVGDLKNLETLEHYEAQIAHFERLLDIRPQTLVCDLHPDYLSTGYAERRAAREGLPLVRVQHHHAHMASCMADNRLEGDVLGVIWDGTGYGPDGTTWGGEFLTGGYADFTRVASLRPMLLPGGDRAVREPWRVGISLLRDAGEDPADFFSPAQVQRIDVLLTQRLNCPVSTGMGRLFDGVSALLGIASEASYEGQGAVLLEAAADEDCTQTLPYALNEQDGLLRIDHRPMISALTRGRRDGVPTGTLSAAFMNTLVSAAAEVCELLAQRTGLRRVVLSGGTFQNMYMLHRLTSALRARGLEVFRHSRVPTNDEGISLGQILIAQRGGGLHVPRSAAQDH